MNLGVPLSASKLFRFSDGEIGVSMKSVRGADICGTAYMRTG